MAKTDVDFHQQRRQMVSRQLKARDISDQRVLEVMADLPRELFLEPALRSQAYSDSPLPISQGQTISQPYIQALMSQGLKLTGCEKVLEIGTGSGYQTAILARLSSQVFTIERWDNLSTAARKLLDSLGLTNIQYFVADGSQGLPEHAPFDAILITAACPQVPPPLQQQLAQNGRLLAPVGSMATQELILFERTADRIVQQTICPCRFVPLLGKYAFK